MLEPEKRISVEHPFIATLGKPSVFKIVLGCQFVEFDGIFCHQGSHFAVINVHFLGNSSLSYRLYSLLSPLGINDILFPDWLGDNQIVFSTDFQHPDSKFPDSVDNFTKLPLSDDSKRKLLLGQLRRLLRTLVTDEGHKMVQPKRLAHLVLRVRDLERSERFYTDTLGLKVTGKIPGTMVFMGAEPQSSHELALMSVGPDAPGPEQGRVGLYHFAWEMGSFDDLKRMYQTLKQKGADIAGIGDHGISMGVYFFDPDGNEIEVFYELPRSQWPEGGVVSRDKFPWSLEEEETALKPA